MMFPYEQVITESPESSPLSVKAHLSRRKYPFVSIFYIDRLDRTREIDVIAAGDSDSVLSFNSICM